MTSTKTPLTPAEHRAQAEASLDGMSSYAPDEPQYRTLALAAIAHVLVAVAAYLEPPPLPAVPGLPDGWQLAVEQSKGGNRKWSYLLTEPDGTPHYTQHRWETPQYATAAGVAAARAAQHQNQNGEQL